MTQAKAGTIHELESFRDRTRVFSDRAVAGQVLAGMLTAYRNSDALVLGIPAGGAVVAAVIAHRLGLALDMAVVNKITPPSNTEWGFGAVAFDGTVLMNEPIASQLNLGPEELDACVRRTREKVTRRVARFRGSGDAPDVAGRSIILVDDGLATGITARAAMDALLRAGAGETVLAVPTGHQASLADVARGGAARRIFCVNVRTGPTFAVADAYECWRDLADEDVLHVLAVVDGDRPPSNEADGGGP